MARIHQLPPNVITKIAAGEVIERPASVVKEMLENSIDAGATRIDVEIENGGMDRIVIVDNGGGIEADDLLLVFASHATSKLSDADDLFRVATLGFRGEAMASIGSVAQVTLQSRPAEAPSGAEVHCRGGELSPVKPWNGAPGTRIEVRHLFYNTPVRRKFLRASQTEIAHCTEAFTRIALAQPQIHFTLRHNDKLLFDLPPTEAWRERIAAFFGRDLEGGLIPIDNRDEGVRLFGFVADPQHSRANNRLQYILLNGRFIRDRSLQHALGEAYRGLLLTGRFPIAFLRLEVPADAVDVNVHPTKLEVRFADSGRIYSLLLGTIRKKFLATDLTARVRPTAEPVAAGEEAADAAAVAAHRENLVAWARGAAAAPAAVAPAAASGTALADLEEANQALLELRFDPPPGPPLALHRLERSWPAGPVSPRQHEAAEEAGRRTPLSAPPPAPALAPPARQSHLGFQVHNRYLVTENDEGMLVIDQHALHERILYEQLRARVLAGDFEKQRLLVPEPVTLRPEESAAVLTKQELLGRLGIDVEPFGGDTVLVSSYPAMLANLAPAQMLRSVAETLLASEKPPERRDLLDELLHMMACKAAIKAGDRLSCEEITSLLEQRQHALDAHHCPHGRPTALLFTREELDRRFKRT